METFDTSTVTILLSQLGYRLPYLLIDIVGIGLSVFNYTTYPKTAFRSSIGFIINFIVSIAAIPASLMPLLLRDLGIFAVGFYMSLIWLVMTLLGAVGWGFVLWAVWTKESEKYASPPPPSF